jgi:hypothetical protein
MLYSRRIWRVDPAARWRMGRAKESQLSDPPKFEQWAFGLSVQLRPRQRSLLKCLVEPAASA